MTRTENVFTRKDFAHVALVTSHTPPAAHITAAKHDVQKRAMK
jgi:hypothetical protein